MQTQLVTKSQLVEVLRGLKTSTFARIISSTEPKVKKGCPYAGLKKISSALVNINYSYGNAVNNRRNKENREADFKSAPRIWGNKIPNTPLIENDGEYYLETRFMNAPKETIYVSNGNVVESEKVKPFLYATSSSSRQQVENPVIVRNFKISNIVEIQINKVNYKLI